MSAVIFLTVGPVKTSKGDKGAKNQGKGIQVLRGFYRVQWPIRVISKTKPQKPKTSFCRTKILRICNALVILWIHGYRRIGGEIR